MARKRGDGVQRHMGLKQAQTCRTIQLSGSPQPGPLTAQVQGRIMAIPEAGSRALLDTVCPEFLLVK